MTKRADHDSDRGAGNPLDAGAASPSVIRDRNPELQDLWDRYKEEPTERIRETLIVHYSPLVKYVGGRVAVGLPPNVEQSDLVSYGMFGLIDAIDKFEPERGYKFETYAISRIKGAILDELRSIDWVPRSVRSKLRQIEKAIAKLESLHHRPATDAELAEELEWTDEQLHTALNQISQVGLAALDEVLTVSGDKGEAITLGDTIADKSAHGPMGAFEVAETRQLLGQAINALPEREKLVLTLYYYESMTLQEVGMVLGVTESRVCQIHTKAVLHLRSRLQAAERIPSE
ncbi:MAG: RNA polymerase sigma factor WhiG [Actinomycetia bacterium]|nr:RNA polymerase sigma factor WhiG [Actinomycetes bacterium]